MFATIKIHSDMADVTKHWLNKKGFKKAGNFFELEKDDVTFGFDLTNGLCWIDSDNVYIMKSADTTEEVEQIYKVCGFDLNFNKVESESEDSYPITPVWLAMTGFEKRGENRWILNQNDDTIKYDTKEKKMSVIKGKEGFEGKVKSEDLARKLMNEIFV